MKHTILKHEPTGAPSGERSNHPVIPYHGIHGRSVGAGHVDYRRRACMVCGVSIGNHHVDGCPETHRDLNVARPFKEFSLDEHLIITELSGVPFRGTGWGGFGGDDVTYDEIYASAPNPDRSRYMPPPTQTLHEAIELVKRHFAADAEEEQSPAAVRSWAREHGYRVGDRGRLPSDVVAAYQQRETD